MFHLKACYNKLLFCAPDCGEMFKISGELLKLGNDLSLFAKINITELVHIFMCNYLDFSETQK